ncbi:hypothetical protein [Nonomuraea wenchangensis]|uniref:hypothetical protein n=1 Tax=Nonomuraea wenchangensis TaxID=568860 RepID=UPI00379ECA9A
MERLDPVPRRRRQGGGARAARRRRRARRPAQGAAAGAALALAGGALVLVPVLASALAPEIRGNGGHANEGPLAILLCWSVGLPVLFAGLVRWGLLLRRRAGGGRPAEPAAAIRPVVRP